MTPEESKEKLFYTKEELDEFRQIINKKLAIAREEYGSLEESLKDASEAASDGHNLTDFGSDTLDKEQIELFMTRQIKFVDALERALVRIENGTYGRCKVTGKLISKERLRIVPHTESSMEAKLQQGK
jgi:RNA polymerase-binding transcription factor DksA